MSTQMLTPPTEAHIVRSMPELKTWLSRIRMEYGGPVEYACVLVPDGVYAQYRFIQGKEVGFTALTDNGSHPYVDPGGRLHNAVVEGIITNDRFYAHRVLELSGDLMHDKVTTNFSVLRNVGSFETPETVFTAGKTDNEVVMLCTHIDDYQNAYKVAGLLITTNDQRFRQVLTLDKNNPAPEIMYIPSKAVPQEAPKEEVRKVLTFDFAGRFSQDDKNEAIRLIDCMGHKIASSSNDNIDYLIVSTDNLIVDQDKQTAKIKQAREKNITMGTVSFLKDLLTISPHS